MTDYFSPGEFHSYHRDQVVFFLNECRESWPQKESNYTDAPISHQSSSHMPGETESLVRAEITQRISMCGDYGVRLYVEIIAKGKERPVEFDDLSSDSRSAVSYVCGLCRRWQSCENCLVKKCKRRGRKPCTFEQWINHRLR